MGDRSNGEPGRQPVTVQIAPRTIVVAVPVVTAVWLLFRLTDFLLVLVFAILIATAIDQPVGWRQRRGLPRPLGIAALYVVLVSLLVLIAGVELLGIAGALLAVAVTVIIWVIAEELLPPRAADPAPAETPRPLSPEQRLPSG